MLETSLGGDHGQCLEFGILQAGDSRVDSQTRGLAAWNRHSCRNMSTVQPLRRTTW